jgi:hypothetical protein
VPPGHAQVVAHDRWAVPIPVRSVPPEEMGDPPTGRESTGPRRRPAVIAEVLSRIDPGASGSASVVQGRAEAPAASEVFATGTGCSGRDRAAAPSPEADARMAGMRTGARMMTRSARVDRIGVG